MFHSTLSLLTCTLTLFALSTDAQTTSNIGYTGTLSSLDGGLGGVVTVKDADTLTISSYTLKDASAPALYWWGTTTSKISSGFRISNEQVKSAATSDMLEIKLDAGKNSSTFTTVGLWCERLNANFGQAELKAAAGTGAATSSGVAATETKKGAAARNGVVGVAVGVMVVAGTFVVCMV